MIPTSSRWTRGASGGFTSKIVRLGPLTRTLLCHNNSFFFVSACSGIGFSVGVVASVILFRRA
jgi:hypothetical protein